LQPVAAIIILTLYTGVHIVIHLILILQQTGVHLPLLSILQHTEIFNFIPGGANSLVLHVLFWILQFQSETRLYINT